MGKTGEFEVLLASADRKKLLRMKNVVAAMDIVRDYDVAFGGREALEQAKKLKPDLLIVDMILPFIDGLGVLESIKSDSELSSIKVMIMSQVSNDFMRKTAYKLGADYFADGDISDATLERRIRELLKFDRAAKWIDSGADDGELVISISLVLQRLGVGMKTKGYAFLREALLMYIKNEDCIEDMSKLVYPAIAERYNTTPACVERDMRTSLEGAWGKGDMDYAEKLFGYSIDEEKGKPTNRAFIATVADYIKINRFNLN